MKTPYPVDKKVYIGQFFGENANSYYVNNGLLGHPGIDFGSASNYGSTITSVCNEVVYKILNEGDPDPSKYRAVCTLGEDSVERVYGHLKDIWVEAGEQLVALQPIGTMGNFGEVYSHGVLITSEKKLSGSKDGTHLHYQERPFILSRAALPSKFYLGDNNDNIYYDKNNNCYEIINKNNGFNGCTDPLPNLYYPTIFQKILFWIKVGNNIKENSM